MSAEPLPTFKYFSDPVADGVIRGSQAAAYLGRAGHEELTGKWAAAVASIKSESRMEGADWEVYFRGLHADGDCTAYVFRCLHCGQLGGYSDCN